MGGFECTSQLDADAERLHPIEGSVLPDQGFQRILLVVGHYQVWAAARVVPTCMMVTIFG